MIPSNFRIEILAIRALLCALGGTKGLMLNHWYKKHELILREACITYRDWWFQQIMFLFNSSTFHSKFHIEIFFPESDARYLETLSDIYFLKEILICTELFKFWINHIHGTFFFFQPRASLPAQSQTLMSTTNASSPKWRRFSLWLPLVSGDKRSSPLLLISDMTLRNFGSPVHFPKTYMTNER